MPILTSLSVLSAGVIAADNATAPVLSELYAAAHAQQLKPELVMVGTIDENGLPQIRVMSNLRHPSFAASKLAGESDFSAYAVTNADSEKLRQLEKNPTMSMYYQFGGQGLLLMGKAEALTDAASRNAAWDEQFKRLGYSGKDDPKLVVLRFTPERGKFYYQGKQNHLTFPLAAQLQKDPNIKDPEAPFTFIDLMEIAPNEIPQFIADWDARAKTMGQLPGYITSTLYKSLLPDSTYQLVDVSQWQSYNAFIAALNDPAYAKQLSTDESATPSLILHRGFYRPVASNTHIYSDAHADGQARPSINRVVKNPAIKDPEAPCLFLNLMEMTPADAKVFIADWKVRSQITRQQPGFISSALNKTLLPGSKYEIINVSQWQSYDAWVNANNNPTYSTQLETDLNQTTSIKLTRGFYRPVASYTHLYE